MVVARQLQQQGMPSAATPGADGSLHYPRAVLSGGRRPPRPTSLRASRHKLRTSRSAPDEKYFVYLGCLGHLRKEQEIREHAPNVRCAPAW